MLNEPVYLEFRLQYCKNLLIENIFNPWYATNKKNKQNTVYFYVKRSASNKNCICILIGLINLCISEVVTETCSAKYVF